MLVALLSEYAVISKLSPDVLSLSADAIDARVEEVIVETTPLIDFKILTD